MVKKIFSIVLPLILVQNFLFAASPPADKTGDLAVNFNLLDLEDEEISLSKFRGKPVILFFWTTWCPFCRGELKTLNDNYHRLLKDGIQLLAIDIGEAAGRVENFVKKQGIFFNILLDKDTKVAYSYNLLGVPTYILVDKKGQIIFKGNSFPQEYKKLLTQ